MRESFTHSLSSRNIHRSYMFYCNASNPVVGQSLFYSSHTTFLHWVNNDLVLNLPNLECDLEDKPHIFDINRTDNSGYIDSMFRHLFK